MLINVRFDIGTVICPRAVEAKGQYQIYYLMTILLHNNYLFKIPMF